MYCITLYFRGRKISRKVNFKYFREKIFSRIYCSRENIFPRKYLPAKISSRENILSRKYLPAKISSRENIFPRLFPCRKYSRLVGLGYAVIEDTGSRPNVRFWIRIKPAQPLHISYHFESRSFLFLPDEKHSAQKNVLCIYHSLTKGVYWMQKRSEIVKTQTPIWTRSRRAHNPN